MALGLLAALAPPGMLAAQRPPNERVIAEFDKRRTKVLAEAAQRRLRLGSWCRDMGLVRQATAQFLRAQEVGEGQNPGAVTVVNLMRSLDDAFWKKNRKNPPGRMLRQYDRRARDLDEADREDRFALADWAHDRDLLEQATALYRVLLAEHDGAIVRDEQGRIVLDGGKIPADVAAILASKSVAVAGTERVRDRFLELVPEGGELFEHADQALVVQSQVSTEQARELHALLSLLLPHLADAVGGEPTRQLRVFVFATRESFLGYLRASGYGESHAAGLTDPQSFVAMVCAEGHGPDVVRAVAMHELVHLYDFAVAPVVFPSWYTEAFAETWGGHGTYRVVDGALEVGGMLQDHELEALRSALDGGARAGDPAAEVDAKPALFPLRELIALDANALLRADAARAALFYAQSWAFLRYLRTAAGDDVADRLRTWELRCRGGAIGAVAGQPRQRDEMPAARLFDSAFGRDLDELEKGFVAWLRLL